MISNMISLILLGLLHTAWSKSLHDQLLPPQTNYLSCGKLYYRTVLLDEARNTLYVGAMDKLFKVNLANVSKTSCDYDSLTLEPSNSAQCVSKGKSENYDCRNHVRVIQPLGPDGERLYVCGTNGHNPRDVVVYANLTNLGRHEYVAGVGNGIAKCPFDPEDNSTAVWVESGNPGELPALYSGTNAEFTKADTVIFRTDLYDLNNGRREYGFKRTIKYDSHMLDKPDFVGSYEVGEYVYFFFREVAVEYMNCGKAVYSRVARVCKKDTGGKNILNQNWATYLKARLNCSLPGEFPFYFNEIQSVHKLASDDTTFHAVFTTGLNGLMGSAVCSFNIDDITEAFDGKFKEQESSTSAWLPVASSKVPEPRPGTCVEDTRELPDRVLNFIRTHPLMDSTVAHQGGAPVFYKRDVIFTNLVVDRVTAGLYGDKKEFSIFYIGTKSGQVYKVSQWTDDDGKLQSQLLDSFQGTAEEEPIRAMEISRTRRQLYITSDTGIRQIDLNLCSLRYDTCLQCSRDPSCGWDREAGACRSYDSTHLHDPTGTKSGLCDSFLFKRKLMANFGQSVHLSCSLGQVEMTGGPEVEWHHYSKSRGRYTVTFAPEKHIITSEQGLVVISISEADSGRYDCVHRGQLVSSYHIAVDSHRCSAPNKTADYQKIYSDWCNQFEKYKLAIKSWEKKKGKCSKSGGDEITSNEIFDSSRFF